MPHLHGRPSLCTAFALACLAACAPEPQGPRPDVVIVLVDTLRADYVQPYGFDRETTPELAALADESVVFEQAHATAPWTLPSVVSLMTGRHVTEHQVTNEKFLLAPEVPVLAQLLHDEGYSTASYVKNPFAGEMSGLDRGFDECTLVPRPLDAGQLNAFLERVDERPYFLYVHKAEPHDPYRTRPRFRQIFDPVDPEFLQTYEETIRDYRSLTRIDFVRGRPLGTTDNTERQQERLQELNDRLAEARNLYACSVRDADERVGAIVRGLRETGRWDQTLFVLVSDHGEEMGDHGGWQHDQSVYQELLHVPLIVKLPGGAHAGERVSTPVSLVDLFPTVLDAARIEPPEGLSGSSLLELLGQPEREPAARVVAVRQNDRKYFRPYKETRGDENVAVRWGDWKAILNVEPGTVELYDLSVDPTEQRDLVRERPDVAAELRRVATEGRAALQARAVTPVPADSIDEDSEEGRAIRDLGYVGGEEDE